VLANLALEEGEEELPQVLSEIARVWKEPGEKNLLAALK